MTIDEQVQKMKIMGNIEGEQDDLLMVYLDLAKQKLIEHIYPFRDDVVSLDKKYDTKQIELAIILYNKRGAEGEEHRDHRDPVFRRRQKRPLDQRTRLLVAPPERPLGVEQNELIA